MKRYRPVRAVWLMLAVLLAASWAAILPDAAAADAKPLIYDEAGLLLPEERESLQAMAAQYGAERETDMIVFTTLNPDNIDVMKLTQDFYDEKAPGYDKPHGNAVLLTMDMKNREVYLAGFYKAEQYLDDDRLDRIRSRITPDLSAGAYASAFQTYVETAHRYMGFPPGVNPDNLLFRGWFQLAVALAVAGLVVGLMAYRSGGRVTVHRQTYEDAGTSGVLKHRDQYIRTTVTKQKIVTNSGGSGGGGGGRTGGGHSHSGSRGSF